LRGLGETRRILVQAGDEAARAARMPVAEGARGGQTGHAEVLGIPGAEVPRCWGAGACWHASARRGGRPERRDHGPASDHGGSRGRAPARSAGIKDQFMITDHHAGDRPTAAGTCWHDSSPRGHRPKRRDHGRAGDHGGSRGRAPARTAGIKDRFMITDHYAGDHPTAAGTCWHDSSPRGRRPERRDHGRAGDHGGSRERAPTRTAGIKDQFMITDHHAGDHPTAAGQAGFGKPCWVVKTMW
jgi:hypothetical protein